MSGIGGRRSVKFPEANLLLACGSFWPDSMVDKGSVMKMLVHVLNLEAPPDIEIEHWAFELAASGACNASGDSVVDMRCFIAFCLLQEHVEGTQTVLGGLPAPEQEDELLTAPSEMRATINTKPRAPSDPSGGDTISSSWSLSTAEVVGEQPTLPSLEDQAGVVLVVDSKEYVLGERLGHGGGGSVYAATLKREAAHVHAATAAGDGESDSHDPDSKALKLAGGDGDADFRGADTSLAAVAVEAVAAAEVRKLTHSEVMKWQGR
eukprot:3256415-Amphidinium_carterae.1